jgi:hypothetical protein
MALSASRSACAEEREPRYRYISLDAALPPDFVFLDPIKITDDRRVYGTAYSCPSDCIPWIFVYRSGRLTVLDRGFAYTANEDGVVGGSVLTDPANPSEQAALFHGHHQIELIPPLPGERASHVLELTDSGIALVESIDSVTFASTFYLYRHGRVTALNLGFDQTRFIHVNDRGVVAGTSFDLGTRRSRAFRYDPRSGTMTTLDPLSTEPDSWGLGINDRGDVLGYSFVSGGLERIGAWHDRTFQTYFVEGTPEFPTVSNRLLWNRNGLIVITDTAGPDLGSYLVPAPGVRLRLADLSDHLPTWTVIQGVNGRGDLVGAGGSSRAIIEETFLLERADCDDRD